MDPMGVLRRVFTLPRVAVALASVAILTGCATTEIRSRRDASYRERLTKTAIISQVQQYLRDDWGEGFARIFEERLAAGLMARGVRVLVISIDELGLDNSVYTQRLNQFGPSTVLAVRPVGNQRDGYGSIIAVRFDVSVGPPARSAPRVWRAAVELRGMGDTETRATRLARDIIAKLTEDGLL